MLCALVAALPTVGAVRATVMAGISEDDQIREADTIFRGTVQRIDVARESVNGQPPVVVTTVSFLPLAVYKGTPSSPVVLKFLGGTIDGRTMRVDGMPQFSAGREYVIFASTKSRLVCPTVGWSDGSLKVDRDRDPAGIVSVSREVAGRPAAAITAKSRTVLTAGESTLPAFEARLKERVEALGAAR